MPFPCAPRVDASAFHLRMRAAIPEGRNKEECENRGANPLHPRNKRGGLLPEDDSVVASVVLRRRGSSQRHCGLSREQEESKCLLQI